MTAIRKKRIFLLLAAAIILSLACVLWQLSRSMLPEEKALRNEMVTIAQQYL